MRKLVLSICLTLAMGAVTGNVAAQAVDADEGTRYALQAMGACAAAAAALATSGARVTGFNTYDLFLPGDMRASVFTAGVSKVLAKTLIMLMTIKESSRTRYGNVVQALSGGSTTVQGTIISFDTRYKLPPDLDTVQGPLGKLIGVPGAIGAAVLYLNSDDYKCTEVKRNKFQKYAQAGDYVAFISNDPLDETLSEQLVLQPIGGAGVPATNELGVFFGQVNADALEGVNPNPFSAAQGWALVGLPRVSLSMPGQSVAVNPYQLARNATTLYNSDGKQVKLLK